MMESKKMEFKKMEFKKMEPKLEGKEANFRCNLDLVHYVALNLRAKFMPYNLKMSFVFLF